jgi:hypothetical protein
MELKRVHGEEIEGSALHTAGGADEAAIDNLVMQAKDFEDLSSLVRLERRDPHFRHHFQYPVVNRVPIVVHEFVYGLIALHAVKEDVNSDNRKNGM